MNDRQQNDWQRESAREERLLRWTLIACAVAVLSVAGWAIWRGGGEEGGIGASGRVHVIPWHPPAPRHR